MSLPAWRLVALVVGCSCKSSPPEPQARDAGARDPWVSAGCDYGDPQCERECDAGNLGSCANFGLMLATGFRVGKDVERGRAILERACNASDGVSCSGLGNVYESALDDPLRAADAYERGCNLGFPGACGNLGILLHDGRGRTQDLARAKTLLQSACTAGDPNSCEHMARW